MAFLFCLLSGDADLGFATSETSSAPPPGAQAPGSYPGAGTGLSIQPPLPMMSQDALLGSEGSDAVSRALRNAIATQPEVPASGGLLRDSIVTQEIRYELTGADEVFLVWWVDGWHILPEGKRPPQTVVKNGAMFTPMSRTGNTFTTRVDVRVGTHINCGFQITKTSKKSPVDIWDVNGYPPRNYQIIARPGRPAVIVATLSLDKAQTEGNRTYAPLVTQEIRYHAKAVSQVTLVWGINGWQSLDEVLRPSGTVVSGKLMHTPMAKPADAGDLFIVKVRVPMGAIVDYGFLITKTNGGNKIETWEGSSDFRNTVTEEGIIEVDAGKIRNRTRLTPGEPGLSGAEAGGTLDINAKSGIAKQNILQSEIRDNFSQTVVRSPESPGKPFPVGQVFVAALLLLALLMFLKARVLKP